MLQVALEGVIKQVFVERQPEESEEAFEERRISFPFAHQGESAQQRAERMQLDAKRRHNRNVAFKAKLQTELIELDAREPFLNELYRQINDECLAIRIRRREVERRLQEANT